MKSVGFLSNSKEFNFDNHVLRMDCGDGPIMRRAASVATFRAGLYFEHTSVRVG